MSTLYLHPLPENLPFFTIRCERFPFGYDDFKLCVLVILDLAFKTFEFRNVGRKGDYYRYLAEFKTGNEKKEAADQSLKAYQVCSFYICFGFLRSA